MFFTFLTITYNHEKYIIQHLESIKNQIVKYGDGLRFQLILSDDSSTDKTIEISKRWLKENESLFFRIDILESEVNQGTCKNYTKGLNEIKGEFFKALAGDDVFTSENIFSAVELLNTYDIVCTPTGPFTDEGLYLDKKIYSRIFEMYNYCSRDYNLIRRKYISVPMTPGVLMRKEILTPEIINFINQYALIEDLSSYIKIYEEHSKLNIGYYEKVLVLYRYHETAITKTNNERVRNLFLEDKTNLHKYIIKNTDSLSVKLKNHYGIFLDKISNRKLAFLLDINVYIYRITFVLNYFKYKGRMKDIRDNSFLPNVEYLEWLFKEAQKYDI